VYLKIKVFVGSKISYLNKLHLFLFSKILGCYTSLANPGNNLLELLLPLWHRDTKKGKERCYVPKSLLIGFLILVGVLAILLLFFFLGLKFLNIWGSPAMRRTGDKGIANRARYLRTPETR
jgi:hypothetical protein